MPTTFPENSIGLVAAKTAKSQTPLQLESGYLLPSFELVYETYGKLNAKKSNAILVCHALSGDHHAAGYRSEEDKYPGWWEQAVGPGKAIDTNRFFVVCSNNLGGCHGSTGPLSPNPETGQPYANDFPIVTVKDWVNSQKWLMEELGIPKWSAIIGGSLGGMQAIQWSIDYPELLDHCIAIASAPNLTAQNIAFNEVARQAIMTDPDFHDGQYQAHNTIPDRGLKLARMLGHITYLSDDAMGEKFGRDLQRGKLHYDFGAEFQVESYLRYQGEKFSASFDANTYLRMTKALDYFDPAAEYDNNLSLALSQASASFLIMSFTTDWRFPPERSKKITSALLDAGKNVSYVEVESQSGHDAFLLNIPHYMSVFKAYMQNIRFDEDNAASQQCAQETSHA